MHSGGIQKAKSSRPLTNVYLEGEIEDEMDLRYCDELSCEIVPLTMTPHND